MRSLHVYPLLLCTLFSMTAVAAPDSLAPAVAADQALAGTLASSSLLLSLAVFFGLGLLLAFTPCSLPMLPILAGVVVGSGARPARGLWLATSYVLSMALVYAGLGVLAALLGANLQALLQHPWVLASFAGLFVLLALPMFGVFELQLPGAVRDRLERAGRQRQGGSLAGAAALGVLSGLLIGPCMTAPLAGALLYIAQSGNAVHGALVLFAMGLGMGLPLLLLVTFGSHLLPKPGRWMDVIKGIFGLLFLATALLLVRPLLPASLWLALAGLLGIASLVTALVKTPRSLPCLLLGTGFGVWGLIMVLGAAGGAKDLWQPLDIYRGTAPVAPAAAAQRFTPVNDLQGLQAQLAAARSAGQWSLLYYSADWCPVCRAMDDGVFNDPAFFQAMAGLKLIKVDITADTPASQALRAHYQVSGPPTLIWVDAQGQEVRSHRLIGQHDLAGLVQALASAQATAQ